MLLKLLLLLVVLAPVPAPPPPDPLGFGYLGVKVANPDAAGADLTLSAVVDGQPAARAGLRVGDRLERLGPLTPRRFEEVREYVSGLRPGTRLRVEAVRAGRPVVVTVVVGVFPADLLRQDPFDDRGRLQPIPPNR